MSYSVKVKNELAEIVPVPKHCQIAELTGYFLFTQKKIIDKCDMPVLKSIIGDKNCEVFIKESCKIVENNGFWELSDESVIKRSCCIRSFVRGAFLGAGSITDPADGYHLEFTSGDQKLIALLERILCTFDVEGKTVVRGNRYGLYFKDADKISDLLNIMEAHVALMDFENERIVKEVRNNVNRRVNCETANLKKTVLASEYARDCINYLTEKDALCKLPEGIQTIARLRVEYPEKSLAELGEMLTPKLGRSGVNHRLEKIILLAQELREKEETK